MHFSVVIDWAGPYGGHNDRRSGYTGSGVDRVAMWFPTPRTGVCTSRAMFEWAVRELVTPESPSKREQKRMASGVVSRRLQRGAVREGPYVARVTTWPDDFNPEDPDGSCLFEIFFFEVRYGRGGRPSVDVAVRAHRAKWIEEVPVADRPPWATDERVLPPSRRPLS